MKLILNLNSILQGQRKNACHQHPIFSYDLQMLKIEHPHFDFLYIYRYIHFVEVFLMYELALIFPFTYF